MSIELRPYQRQAVDSIYRYFEHNAGSPIVVVPTAGGKTPIMATFMSEALAQWPDTRIVLLSHVKELLDQSARTLFEIWPSAPLSIYSAGLGSKDLRGKIVIAGIQSIYKKAAALGRVDLVLVDECHLLSDSDTGMYRRFLADLATVNGAPVPVIGFSATPWRENGGLLHRGPKRIFTDICFEIGIGELIEAGWLTPLRCKRTAAELSTAGVRIRNGEYVAGELQAAVDRADINEAIVAELCERGADRRSWLLFATGVEHARHLGDLLQARGIPGGCVFGETPSDERAYLISEFRAGRRRYLITVAALLIGFDAPCVDLLGNAAPTKSLGRYVQKLGRGMRLAPGKTDTLVLDWAGDVAEHGPVDLVRGVDRKSAEGEKPAAPPVKTCPECEEVVHAGFRHCPACGHEFPAPDMAERLHDRAIEAAVLSSELVASDWLPVTGVEYAEHEKAGKPPSIKVTYRCGLARYSTWLCFSHSGYAREKAVRWWAKRMPSHPVPSTTEYAMDLLWHDRPEDPSAIRVLRRGSYFDVVAVRF